MFQVLNSTVNTQAMLKHIVGPGAMKMGVKGKYVSDFRITWPKAKECDLVHPASHLLLFQKFNFLLKFSITGSLVVKIVFLSPYTKEDREI